MNNNFKINTNQPELKVGTNVDEMYYFHEFNFLDSINYLNLFTSLLLYTAEELKLEINNLTHYQDDKEDFILTFTINRKDYFYIAKLINDIENEDLENFQFYSQKEYLKLIEEILENYNDND